MKVNTSKSKNAESFYIKQSYIDANGKSTSRTVRKLGTLEELLKKHGPTRDDVMEWAREQARIETEKYEQEKEMNCSPSRGQRKNIKFSRPAAKRCWPLFMQQGITCVFPSASARPSYAALSWCCNNGCSTQSFARVPVCW